MQPWTIHPHCSDSLCGRPRSTVPSLLPQGQLDPTARDGEGELEREPVRCEVSEADDLRSAQER